MRLLTTILILFLAYQNVAFSREGKKDAVYHFVYNLRTQYRYVDVRFTESNDTLFFHWSRETDEGLRSGSYAMPRHSREHARQICYIMPANSKTIITPDNELFAFISRDAYDELKKEGKCLFNNTTLTLLETNGGMLHVRDYDEGYEMWVEDNHDFPLIHKMINNPIGIDWKIEIQ